MKYLEHHWIILAIQTNRDLRMICVPNVFASILALRQTLQIAKDISLYHKQQLFTDL